MKKLFLAALMLNAYVCFGQLNAYDSAYIEWTQWDKYDNLDLKCESLGKKDTLPVLVIVFFDSSNEEANFTAKGYQIVEVTKNTYPNGLIEIEEESPCDLMYDVVKYLDIYWHEYDPKFVVGQLGLQAPRPPTAEP